jgi:hypothetical protein
VPLRGPREATFVAEGDGQGRACPRECRKAEAAAHPGYGELKLRAEGAKLPSRRLVAHWYWL